MNQKTNSLIKSILAIFAISIIVACSSDDDNNPCANSTLAVAAIAEEYTIKASATGGVEPYEYSIDGTTFQSADTFEDVESGDYTLTVRDANNCTSTTSVSETHLNSLLDERDGQRYKIVKIGNQIWLAENFNFNTNTATETSSWCYNDVAANCDTHGRLYTWEAASQVAPEGWGLPTQGHWQVLINEVGENVAHTALINGEFQSLLGGLRTDNGTFTNSGVWGYYWTSTAVDDAYNYIYAISDNVASEGQSFSSWAMSVRLIKLQSS